MSLVHVFTTSVRRRTAVTAATALAMAALTIVAFPPAAQAAAGITLGKSGPATVLADGTATYTLTAGNPASNPTAAPEYNLSFRDVLPLGVTYVPGSTTPASAGAPRIVIGVGG